jgi:hypothetical protein
MDGLKSRSMKLLMTLLSPNLQLVEKQSLCDFCIMLHSGSNDFCFPGSIHDNAVADWGRLYNELMWCTIRQVWNLWLTLHF